nr:glycosyl hydrolase 115 family protein [uncultured Paraglaciecola sp.]
MKHVIAKHKLFALVLFLLVSDTASAADFITFSASKGSFAISKDNQPTSMFIDPSERNGLKLALKNLQSDLHKVTGETPNIIHSIAKAQMLIIVGTLDNSGPIKALQKSGKIDIQAIQGQWEAYQIQLVSQPFEGVEQALVISGSDMRGAIFGVYELSSAVGVSPWYWWADVPVAQHEDIFVKADTLVVDWPKVKYRGLFLNDEAPALTGWVQENFGNYNSQFYGHMFELMLRLKANYLWPAMWNNAFNLDDPNNPILAHEMGIVMGTSHHEPMMRADKEWNWTGEGKWDYAVNEKHLYEFWQQGAKRHQKLESIFTLGMRGQEDEPMSEQQNIALLEK